jgi:hypothetical protein
MGCLPSKQLGPPLVRVDEAALTNLDNAKAAESTPLAVEQPAVVETEPKHVPSPVAQDTSPTGRNNTSVCSAEAKVLETEQIEVAAFPKPDVAINCTTDAEAVALTNITCSSARLDQFSSQQEAADIVPAIIKDVSAGLSTSSSTQPDSASSRRASTGLLSSTGAARWEEKKSNFKTCAPEDLLSDVSNLSYLGSGGEHCNMCTAFFVNLAVFRHLTMASHD